METNSFATARKAQLDLTGLRVLVVDDEQDVADLMALVLKDHGASTMAVYAADQLTELASEFDPMMVLLDLGMPRVNGLQACRRLRAALGKDVYLVAVTGWDADEHPHLTRSAGFDMHLIKPVTFDVLAAVAETALLMQR